MNDVAGMGYRYKLCRDDCLILCGELSRLGSACLSFQLVSLPDPTQGGSRNETKPEHVSSPHTTLDSQSESD